MHAQYALPGPYAGHHVCIASHEGLVENGLDIVRFVEPESGFFMLWIHFILLADNKDLGV